MRHDRIMVARLSRFLALATIAASAFLAWVHPQVLDITNVGWVLSGQDWGANALGLAAYLRAGNWPGTATPLMLSPDGIHLLMMDSNPLLGLVLKPLAWALPAGVQFIGWWLLISLALHVRFAWLLLRDRAPDFLSAWLGTALLTLLPALYNRYAHSNLCSHWLILWALWIFGRSRSLAPLGPVAGGDRRRRAGPQLYAADGRGDLGKRDAARADRRRPCRPARRLRPGRRGGRARGRPGRCCTASPTPRFRPAPMAPSRWRSTR